MEISTSTNIVAFMPGRMRNPMEFCIRQCAEGGYRTLDINLCEAMNPWSRLRQDDWEEYIKEIAKLAEELGIRFHQSHLPYYDIFADPQPDETMELLVRRSIIASGMLGVKWCVTHPGTVYGSEKDIAAQIGKNLDYYRKHLETAKRSGVGICLENDFGYLRNDPRLPLFCGNTEELIALTDAFSDPSIGICYDFGHANLCPDPNHRNNLNRIGRRLKAVHVQDNHGKTDEHLMPFYGNIDWQQAMAGLADIGFEGPLTYEIQEHGRNLPNHMKQQVVKESLEVGARLAAMYEKVKKT